MFDIDNYFNQFLRTPHIFNKHDVLRPEFIPEKLPFRDLQIRKIAEIVACTLNKSTPSNIFIFGKTGTGKTAVVRHVSKSLNGHCRDCGIAEPHWIFLNCQQVNTGYRVLAKICQELDPDENIPIAGWPMDVIFDKVLNKLDAKVSNICFLILDEIDILVKNSTKNLDGILYNLARINERLEHARVCIIGISNVLNFKNILDPRVLSSLSEEEIVFPAYNAEELTGILSERAELAFQSSALESGVIPLCAALAAKEHGDARKALDLLRRSGEIAERKNCLKVCEEFVVSAQDDIENDRTREFVENLPLQIKTTLLCVYFIQKHQTSKDIITGDVYNCYLEMQQIIPGLNKLTQRRVSELIRELDLAGILHAQVISRGRQGRSKMIQLNITLEETWKSLSSDKRIAEFLDYYPICLKNMGVSRFNEHNYQKLL